MLLKTSSLTSLPIQARDGEIGNVADLLFEDDTWRVRWLVVRTGSWLLGRKVLLPASHANAVGPGARAIPINLTREKVKDSPGSGVDLPVSRQMETSIYDAYGWSPYWATPGMAYIPGTAAPVLQTSPSGAPGGAPALGAVPGTEQLPGRGSPERGDTHLRSADEVTGYYIHAADGNIGHVADLLVDAAEWTIRFLLVDTKNWWHGRTVRIPTDWVESISWDERSVHLSRTREEVKQAPEHDPSNPVDTDPGDGL